MACKVAENLPLQNLRSSLGLPSQCHSLRQHCVQGLSRNLGNATMGGVGAAMGYCQALFNRAGDSDVHSRAVLEALNMVNAPWSNSHELFWGYRRNETAEQFLTKALSPLAGTGRVPVLISALDPAHDMDEILGITSTRPPVFSGESILLRILLNSEASIEGTVSLIESLLAGAKHSASMPVWWPLLQANFTLEQWALLRRSLGETWPFVNVAVNPFVEEATLNELADQVTVAQFVIGLAEGINSNGNVKLPSEMKIYGATSTATYNVCEYARKLRRADILPTSILLGPSAETWTLAQNVERIQRFLGVFRQAANIVWEPIKNRAAVWSMAA